MLPNAGSPFFGKLLLLGSRNICLILIIAAVLKGSAYGQELNKIALIIGNGNYQHVAHLTNPPHDADLVASQLRSLGFTLVGGKCAEGFDATKI